MSLVVGLLFGAIGTVYLAMARREHDPMYLICGFLLILFPYLFDSVVVIVLVGLVIALFPVAKAKGWF